MESQQNNRILILGASSGIGQEVARQLINMGWTVSVAARREAPLVSLKAIEPSRVEYAVVDILAEDACARLQQLADRTGGIDIYLHAAGIGSQNRQLVLQTEEETVRTNALGFTRAMNWAYHYFEQQGEGHIAVISSIAGTKGLGPAPAYSATKAYLRSFGKSLHYEFRPYGVGVTTVCPAAIATPLYRMSPRLMNWGLKTALVHTPKWLVKRAQRAMFRGRRVVSPSLMNLWLPAFISLLPGFLVAAIWKKLKK